MDSLELELSAGMYIKVDQISGLLRGEHFNWLLLNWRPLLLQKLYFRELVDCRDSYFLIKWRAKTDKKQNMYFRGCEHVENIPR